MTAGDGFAVVLTVLLTAAPAKPESEPPKPAKAAKAESKKPARVTLPFEDDYSKAETLGRRPMRGEWKFADGVVRCAQDDELFKKFKDHGPVIWYDAEFRDATIRFAYKAEKLKTLVFTINDSAGHVFRFTSTPSATGVRAMPAGDEHTWVALKSDGPALRPDVWTEVTVEFRGPKATVKIGSDWSATVEHAAIDRPKTVVGIGFSFGTLFVKDFSIRP